MFQDMPAWADIKTKLKSAFDYVKNNPILDAAATSLLQEIPIVGGFLVKLYERAGGSQEDKSQVILKSIEQLMQLDEEQFNKISKELNENRDIIIENIIENRIVITDLIARSLAEILEEISKNKVEVLESLEEGFRDNLIKLNLGQSSIKIYTFNKRFNPGEKDCWKTGIFTDKEIKSGFDARRSLTDEIIRSVEKNLGTIVYGDPYTGKSILLKRITFELIDRGYVVLFGDGIEANSSLLQALVESIAEKYDKIVIIADNVHKSSSDSIFQVFNDLEHGKAKFLFSAREKQLDMNRPETIIALKNIHNEAKFTTDFNKDFAVLLFKKAIDVTFQGSSKLQGAKYATSLYDYCEGDPLMFNLGLNYSLSGDIQSVQNFSFYINSESFQDFIQKKMQTWIKKIDKFNNTKIWNAALLASIIGLADLRLNLSESTKLLECSDFNSDDIRYLDKEGVLLIEEASDNFKIRHERFSYEFLSLLYRKRFSNSAKKFDQAHNFKEVLKCVWNNISADLIIDLLGTCSYLNTIENYHALSQLITSIYVVPADQFVVSSKFTENEKVKLFCYGLGYFYASTGDYSNALAYYDKAIEVDAKDTWVLVNKAYILNIIGMYEDAIRTCDIALDIDPNFFYAYNNKGVALNNLGKFEEAIECYNKALNIDPNPKYGTVFNNKGSALHNLGKYEEAIVCYDKALGINPNDSDALRYKKSAHEKKERKTLE